MVLGLSAAPKIKGRPVFGDRAQIKIVRTWAAQEAFDALPDCVECHGRGGHGDGYNCETCNGEGKMPDAVNEFEKRFPNFF